MKFAEVLDQRQAEEEQKRTEEQRRSDAAKQQLQQKKDSLQELLGEVEEMEQKKDSSIESVQAEVSRLKDLIEEHRAALESEGIKNVKGLLASEPYQEVEEVEAYEQQTSAHKTTAQAISERGKEIVQGLPEEVRPKPQKMEHELIQQRERGEKRYANLDQIKEAIRAAAADVDKQIFWLTPEGQKAKREEIKARIEDRHKHQKGVPINMATFDAFDKERFVESGDVADARRYGEETRGQLSDFHHKRIDEDSFLKVNQPLLLEMRGAFKQIDQLPQQYEEALKLVDQLKAAYEECDEFVRNIFKSESLSASDIELGVLKLRLSVFDNFYIYSGQPETYFPRRLGDVQSCQPLVQAVKAGRAIMGHLESLDPFQRGMRRDLPDDLPSLIAQAQKELQRFKLLKEAIQKEPALLHDRDFKYKVEAKISKDNPGFFQSTEVGTFVLPDAIHQELNKFNSYGAAKERYAELRGKVSATLAERVDAKLNYEWAQQSLNLYKDSNSVDQIRERQKRKEAIQQGLSKLESYYNGLSDESKDEPLSVTCGERGFSMASARSLTFERELEEECQKLAKERDNLKKSIDLENAKKGPRIFGKDTFEAQRKATITKLEIPWQEKVKGWEKKSNELSKHTFFKNTILPEFRKKCGDVFTAASTGEEAEKVQIVRDAFADYKGTIREFIPTLREKISGASRISPEEDAAVKEYQRLQAEEQSANKVYNERASSSRWHVIKE